MAKTVEDPQLDLETIIDEQINDKGAVITVEPDKTADAVAQPQPEEELDRLRKELDDYKGREAQFRDKITKAESERSEEARKSTSVITEAFKDKESAIEGRIVASQTSLTSIKEQLRNARSTGDIEKEIDLEEKLADERYQLNALNWEKNNLAAVKKTREDAAKNAAVNPQTQTRQYTSTEQKWINEHPRYNTDDEYQSYVWSVDALAKKRGINPDTEAYYDFLNSRLEKQYPAEVKTNTQQRNTFTSTAAPPSRSSSTERVGTNGRQVHLTAAELEAADFIGMSPAEYAKYKLDEEKR